MATYESTSGRGIELDSMVGKYVYVRRTGREAGLLNGGRVQRLDQFGRLVISTPSGTLALPRHAVTEDISDATV